MHGPNDAILAGDAPWRLPQPEPTNLIGLWPGAEPPNHDDVIAQLRNALGDGVHLHGDLSPPDPSMAWCCALAVPGVSEHVVMWTEPAREHDTGADLPGEGIDACRWIIGAETLLDESDPAYSFHSLVQIFTRGLPDMRAVLDVNTTRWYPADRLRETFPATEPVPPADVLWIIQAAEPASTTAGNVWLHTHGLWRCGRAELEMVEVPAEHASIAADLLNQVASLVLERPAPEAGAPYEIGSNLFVTLQPWETVAPFVPPGQPGGMGDREGEHRAAHAGSRAVICDVEPRGAYRKMWTWPQDVVGQLARDEAGVYLTQRLTLRQALLAQTTLDELCGAFMAASARSADPAPRFGVKAGFTSDGDPTSREHLWFEIETIEPTRIRGCLVNRPVTVARLQPGCREWIDRSDVSDWRVAFPDRAYGPTELEALAARVGAKSS